MSGDTTYLLKCIECGAEFLPKGNGTFILAKV